MPEPTSGPAVVGSSVEEPLPTKRLAMVAAITAVAVIALIASPWRGGTMFAYFGIVPGILAVMISPRATFIAAGLTGGAVCIGVLASGSVAASVVWMALVALGVGMASRIGWAGVTSMIAAQVAIVVVSGKVYAKAPAPFNEPHTLTGALPVAAFALGGGLVIAFAAAALLRGFHREALPRLTHPEDRWFTAAVVLLTVVGTWICRQYFPGTRSWWLLLTIYVVLLPEPEQASDRMRDRVLGTVLGAGALIVLTMIIGAHPQTYRVIAIFAVFGVVASAKRSYTLNAAFITVTVLAMASPGAHNPLLLQWQRVGLTMLGVLVTWGTLEGLAALRDRPQPTVGDRRGT